MLSGLGAPEILILAAIVALLFGVGKVGRLGRDVGTSVKEFRAALKDEDNGGKKDAAAPAPALIEEAPAAVQAPVAAPPLPHEPGPPARF
jgi:TatA/E family protein of Tat protein translocase